MAKGKFTNDTGADTLVHEFRGEIKGKVILVTGASPGGLGAWFVEKIVEASPKLVILAGRDVSKVETTANKVKEINSTVGTRILELDTASFASVRKAADEVNKYPEGIDVLVNNIGIMGVPYAKTADGFESHWQTNHLGPFLFTNLVIGKVLASPAGGRVVVVSSTAFRVGGVRYFDYNFHDGESYNPWIAYAASKTANILYARELAKRLGPKGLTAVSICPGPVPTGLQSHGARDIFGSLWGLYKTLGDPRGWQIPKLQEPDIGLKNHVYAAFAPDVKGKLEGLRCCPAARFLSNQSTLTSI